MIYKCKDRTKASVFHPEFSARTYIKVMPGTEWYYIELEKQSDYPNVILKSRLGNRIIELKKEELEKSSFEFKKQSYRANRWLFCITLYNN